MLKYLEGKGVSEEKVKGNPQIDWQKGYFFEDGLFKVAVPALASYILAPERVDKGFMKVRNYLNLNGITTVADLNTGGVNWDLEIGALRRTFDRDDSPVRVRLTPDAAALGAALKSADAAFDFIGKASETNTRHFCEWRRKTFRRWRDVFSIDADVRARLYRRTCGCLDHAAACVCGTCTPLLECRLSDSRAYQWRRRRDDGARRS
jgi:hypothetical protein